VVQEARRERVCDNTIGFRAPVVAIGGVADRHEVAVWARAVLRGEEAEVFAEDLAAE